MSLDEAMERFVAHDFPGALAAIDGELANAPWQRNALQMRATVLSLLNRPQDVLATFDRLVTLDPRNPEALVGRAFALAKVGRTDEAGRTAQRIHALAPNELESFLHAASICAFLRRQGDAVAWYDAAIRAFPRAPDTYRSKAMYLKNGGYYVAAIEAYDQGLWCAPHDSDLWYNRGCAFACLDDKVNALQSLQRAFMISPQLRESVHVDGDYERYHDDPDFIALCGMPPARG